MQKVYYQNVYSGSLLIGHLLVCMRMSNFSKADVTEGEFLVKVDYYVHEAILGYKFCNMEKLWCSWQLLENKNKWPKYKNTFPLR